MNRFAFLRTAPAIAALALVAGLGACASTGSGGGGGRYVITDEEIMSQPNMPAGQLIQRLKPQWFQTRGLDNFEGAQGLLVVVDGVRREQGNIAILNSYQSHDLEEIRYMNRRDATMRYGTDGGGGAILITTRGG